MNYLTRGPAAQPVTGANSLLFHWFQEEVDRVRFVIVVVASQRGVIAPDEVGLSKAIVEMEI
jgi:hypothetical protein